MLSTRTSRQIHNYLYEQGYRFVEASARRASDADLKPFHARLMPIPFEMWSRFSERSFSTRSGNWWEELAKLVAMDLHPVVEARHVVTGRIRPAAAAHIEQIIEDMERGSPRRVPNRTKDLAEVLAVQGPGGVTRTTIADLYVRRADGVEMYFEPKTVMPNKDQAKAVKERILLITAMRQGHRVEAYGSTAYNPAGDHNEYSYPGNYARQFLEIHADFLIGREFWETVGDLDTYDELLEISDEVGSRLDAVIRKVIQGN